MKWNVDTTIEFLRMSKKLSKKYKSILDDIESFKQELSANPFQGDLLTPGIRKNSHGHFLERRWEVKRSTHHHAHLFH